MGWVVFEEDSGRAVKYYRKETAAKAQVTRHNRQVDNDRQLRSSGYSHFSLNPRRWLFCSYADYEGVLMGMREPERKIWVFCRGGKNG